MEKSIMKEMFKSKFMILFIVFMIMITYINSLGIQKLNNKKVDEKQIVMNK